MSQLPHVRRRVLRVEHVLNWCMDWSTGHDGIVALLGDAMHWSDAHGENFHFMLAKACSHYLDDLNHEPTERTLP
jgi:hypothetical protein